MQSMKGATMLLGSMNRQMNLPALQRIAMEFERENEIMDERQEMMDDAIDEATGLEDEEEGEEIVKEILDEIGVDLSQSVRGSYQLRRMSAFYILTLKIRSSERLHQVSRRQQSTRRGWRKRSAEVVQVMTTYKRDWTAFDGDARFPCFVSFLTDVQRAVWSRFLWLSPTSVSTWNLTACN